MPEFMEPIFTREAILRVRFRRHFVERTSYGFLLLLFFGFSLLRRDGHALTTGEAARAAERAFTASALLQLTAAFVLTPLLLAGTLARERESGTLLLLRTTHLPDAAIVFQKLAAGLALECLILLQTIPLTLALMQNGGIDPPAVLRLEAATLLVLVVAGAVTLRCSAGAQNTPAALTTSYAILAAWVIGGSIGLAIVRSFVGFTGIGYLSDFVNPLGPCLQAVDGERYSAVCNWSGLGDWTFAACFPAPLAAAGLLFWRATVRLSRDLRVAPRVRVPLIWRLSPFRSPSPVVAGNPLYERAQRFPIYDRLGLFYTLQWLGVAAVVIASFGLEDWLPFWASVWLFAVPGWIFVNLAFPAICAMSDRQNGLLSALAATPLTATEFAEGTLAAIGRHFLPTPVLVAAASTILITAALYRRNADYFVIAVLLIAVLPFGRLTFYIGLREGLLATNQANAVTRVVRNLLLLVAAFYLCVAVTVVSMGIALGFLILIGIPLSDRLRLAVIREYETLLDRQRVRELTGRPIAEG
jgi:ABC-type transport system involved in multi-copper enzyme maturation permease subunit